MARALPASIETPLERQLVGVGVLALHVLLVWWLVQAAGRGLAGVGAFSTSGSAGEALVIDFVAVPSPASKAQASPTAIASERDAKQDRSDMATLQGSTSEKNILSETGEFVPSEAASDAVSATAAPPVSSTSANKGGNPGDDQLANYHAALRAAIRRKWQALTDRPFPSGCALHMSLASGGALNATSAEGCSLSSEDRRLVEAAALMSQPLPYAGYEAVFVPNLDLAM